MAYRPRLGDAYSSTPTYTPYFDFAKAYANEYASQMVKGTMNAGKGIGETMNEMMDYKSQKDAEAKMDDIRKRAEDEARKGLTDAPGSPNSWYLADGSIDKDKIEDYQQRYREEYDGVNPFLWSNKNRIAWDKHKTAYLQNNVDRLVGQAMDNEAKAVRRVASAALENAESRGSKAYADEVHKQVDAGILTSVEGENLIIKLGKKGLGAGGGVNIGGNNYTQFGALLKSLAARQDAQNAMRLRQEKQQQAAEGATPQGEDVSATIANQDINLNNLPGFQSDLIANEAGDGINMNNLPGIKLDLAEKSSQDFINVDDTGRETTLTHLSIGDRWAETGDETGLLALLNEDEFEDFKRTLNNTYSGITMVPPKNELAPPVWEIGFNAPDFERMIAESANAKGNLSVYEAESLFTKGVTALLLENPKLSSDSILNIYDTSGVFNAFGNGDNDLGKTSAIERIENLRQTINTIQQVGGAPFLETAVKISSKSYADLDETGRPCDAAFVRDFAYPLDSEGKPAALTPLEDIENATVRQHEMQKRERLKKIYARYRERYNKAAYDKNPTPTDKELDEEVQKDGGKFTLWFNSGIGKQELAERQKFSEDILYTALINKLSQSPKINVTSDEGAKKAAINGMNYIGLVEETRNIFSDILGANRMSPSLERYFKARQDAEKAAQDRVRLARKEGATALETVKGLKAEHELKEAAVNVAVKESKDAQAARKKAKEAEEKALAKEQAKVEAKKQTAAIAKELNTLMPASIHWNRVTKEEEMASKDPKMFGFAYVRVPRQELERLKSLGVDERHSVYMKIDGKNPKARVLVDMNNPSDDGTFKISQDAAWEYRNKAEGRGRNRKQEDPIIDMEGYVSYIVEETKN